MGDNNNTTDLRNSAMSLGDHLEELRARLILAITGLAVCTIITFCFGIQIIAFLEIPYRQAIPEVGLQTLTPADGFMTYSTIALIAGVIISSPWIFYQLWMFVAAGLYPKEKRYVYAAVPFSAALFIAGTLFFIFVVSPIMLKFFVTFNKDFLGITSNFTFQSYISFITTMSLIFGLSFQMPIVIFILNKAGLVSLELLRKSRKYVVLVIVIVAAVITPSPDAFSQILLSIPLYILFEVGILLSHFTRRKES